MSDYRSVCDFEGTISSNKWGGDIEINSFPQGKATGIYVERERERYVHRTSLFFKVTEELLYVKAFKHVQH